MNFTDIKNKVVNNQRLSYEDGLFLYNYDNLIEIGQLADFAKQRIIGKSVYFTRNMHYNYTNICKLKCKFCSYSKARDEKGAYTLEHSEVIQRLERNPLLAEIHIVGGLNIHLPFSYYIDLLRTIKKIRPAINIKAFTAVEIDFYAEKYGKTIEEVLTELKKAGLDTMPGGGAEVFSERVRQELYPNKIPADRWLEIHRIAHSLGIKTNVTMLYGHIETTEEKVNHLIRIRELQDETNGFLAYIPLSYHPENNAVDKKFNTTSTEDLKNIAIGRLMLDNLLHIKAYWIMLTPQITQIALKFGADDVDGTVIEESITHAAGSKTDLGTSKDFLENLILETGNKPVERDAFYNIKTLPRKARNSTEINQKQ